MKKIILTATLSTLVFFAIGQTPNKTDLKAKPKAQLDTTFNSGASLLKLQNLNQTQLDDLALLGKLWGFLKYHHPAIAAGNYNWDYELFRIVPKVINSTNKTERNQVLYTWIVNLGDFKTSNTKLPDTVAVKYKPNFNWINASSLSIELKNLLNKLIIAERGPENYYVKIYSEDTPIPFFMHEAAYSKLWYPDAGFRLLSLFRYWNMIEYFYPYKNTLKENWDKTLISYIPRYINATSALEYRLAALALITAIKDSHASLSGGYDPTLSKHFGNLRPAIELTFVGNKPVVTSSKHEIEGGQNGLIKGDEIIAVNSNTIEAILKQKLPLTPGSNEVTQLRNLAPDLLRTNDTSLSIQYKRNNKINTLQLTCVPLAKAYYKKPSTLDTVFKMIHPKVAYIHPGKLKVKYLDGIMQTAMKANALIIDMRTYPQETMFTSSIAKYLFEKPVDFSKMTQGNISRPGLFTYLSNDYMSHMKIGEANSDHFKGKLIILINETTQSFAEFSTMAFSMRPNTLVIGSQTAGADGNVTAAINLPGGIVTLFTGIGVYYPNGKETQRIGIVPDIEIKPSIEGIRLGKDEVLEKALEIAKKP